MSQLNIYIKPHNDIEFLPDGNLRMAKDNEAILQHIRQRLKTWLGEWAYNRRVGIDWDKYVLGIRPPQINIAEATIKKTILETQNVKEILTFSMEFDARNRGFRAFDVSIRTSNDEILEVDL
jgi:hypothetical protein